MEFFKLKRTFDLSKLPCFSRIGILHDSIIMGVSRFGFPASNYLTFCDRVPILDHPDVECNSIVLISSELETKLSKLLPNASLVVVDDPRAMFLDVLDYLKKNNLFNQTSLTPDKPTISSDIEVGEGVVIEAGVQIEAKVVIASGAIIRAGTWLGAGVSVGENSVIGSAGIYVYIGKDGKRRSFQHLAGVIVKQGASIGASCVIARGILTSTQVGSESIIGNLCNLGHGVEVGKNVWISSGTIIGGQTKIGDKTTIALGCAIRDNIMIGAEASIGMGSVVTKNIRTGSSVFGNPAKSFSSINAGPVR